MVHFHPISVHLLRGEIMEVENRFKSEQERVFAKNEQFEGLTWQAHVNWCKYYRGLSSCKYISLVLVVHQPYNTLFQLCLSSSYRSAW